jgi:hypothetical protein
MLLSRALEAETTGNSMRDATKGFARSIDELARASETTAQAPMKRLEAKL